MAKRRLKKSVDAVLRKGEDMWGLPLYYVDIPFGTTTLSNLWKNPFNIDTDAIETSFCKVDFESVFGKLGLRIGGKTKIRITIERLP